MRVPHPAHFLALAVLAAAAAATARAAPVSVWVVQAGKAFEQAGEYTVRSRNTRLQDAIDAYGAPSSCRVAGSANHAVVIWRERRIWIDAWTYGFMPKGENGCTSPDLIHVSEIRLTDRRWRTPRGLRVGDRTTKLRALYPRAVYSQRRRTEYRLVSRHGPCIGSCTRYEETHGVDYPRLTAQVDEGQVVAFWLPVFGQGE